MWLPFCIVVLTAICTIVQDDSVPKSSRDLLQGLSLGFPGYRAWLVQGGYLSARGVYIREVQIRHDEEKERATHEHVVVVLLDIGKCTRASFGDYTYD